MAPVDLTSAYNLLAKTQTFSGRPIRITSIYNSHPEEKCFKVETVDSKAAYKVRFANSTNKLSVATEYEAFCILRQHGITWVPNIYEFQAAYPTYLIVGYEAGESLDKSLRWVPHVKSIVRGIDQLLTDIHNISGDYFGHLGGPRYPSWKAFLDTRFWHHVRLVLSAGLINKGDASRFQSLYDEAIEAFPAIRPMLLHGDVKPANIVFDADRRRVILIDFEIARFGDVDFEWVRLHYLALRWPEYGRLIAQPLLAGTSYTGRRGPGIEAKLLLYALFHVCSLLAFECEVGLPIPTYRLDNLAELLRLIRSRKG
jgi:aminoglycoside phosphotransferase (APT) family kinase protein